MRIIRNATVFLIIFLSGFMVLSQPLDVLYFKGGDVLKGRVMEYLGGDHLSRLVGGEKKNFSGENFKKIKKVKLFEGNYYHKEKGSWHEFYMGLMTGKTGEYSKNENHMSLELIIGHRFNRYLGLGLGTGYQSYSGVDAVPIFLSITGDFLNERITPYYFINAGYGFGIDRSDEWDNYSEVKGGLMYNPGIGFKFRLKKLYISSSVAYRFQLAQFISEQEVYSFNDFIGSSRFFPQTRTQKINRLEFKIGIGF